MDTSDDRYFMIELENTLSSARSPKELYQAIVNGPFVDRLRMTIYGLGIVVFLKVNKRSGTIDRVALSDTEPAKGAVNMSVKEFRDIHIPLDHKTNLIAKAIRTGKPQRTSDWQYLFIPELTPEQARLNQAGAGIDCSFIYPIPDAGDGAALIFSYFEPYSDIGPEQQAFMRTYTRLVGNVLPKSR